MPETNDHGLGDVLRETRDALNSIRLVPLRDSDSEQKLREAVAKIDDLIRQNDELNTAPTEDKPVEPADALAKLLAGHERRITRLEGAPTEIHVHQHFSANRESAEKLVADLERRLRAMGVTP